MLENNLICVHFSTSEFPKPKNLFEAAVRSQLSRVSVSKCRFTNSQIHWWLKDGYVVRTSVVWVSTFEPGMNPGMWWGLKHPTQLVSNASTEIIVTPHMICALNLHGHHLYHTLGHWTSVFNTRLLLSLWYPCMMMPLYSLIADGPNIMVFFTITYRSTQLPTAVWNDTIKISTPIKIERSRSLRCCWISSAGTD